MVWSYTDNLDTFVGILLLSSYNMRGEQKEYWSKDPDLKCDIVRLAMSRKRFYQIKSKIKYSKRKNKDDSDKAWRVRAIVNLFKENILQLGFFSTALSVDEMIVKFFGRSCMKQYIPQKPDRFGFKFWVICTAFGYLLDFDIYCGKNFSNDVLSSCALGSRVVLQMIN